MSRRDVGRDHGAKGRFDLSLGISPRKLHPRRPVRLAGVGVRQLLVGPHPFHLSFSIGGVGLLFLTVLIGANRRDGRVRQLVQGRAAPRRVPDDRAAALFRSALTSDAIDSRISPLDQRYLDPASSLAEVLFGLIMTLTFTLGAGIIIEDEGRKARAAADRVHRLQPRLGHHRRSAVPGR